jgi:DnaJ-class molecular chaperone
MSDTLEAPTYTIATRYKLTCSDCDGTGVVEPLAEPCVECDGTGEVEL